MDPTLTLVFVALVLSCLLCFFSWRPNRKIWIAGQSIPGPNPLSLIGNAFLLLIHKRELFTTLSKYRNEFGDIARGWLGNKLYVVLNDPEDIKCVFGSPRIINKDRYFSVAIKTFLGSGLFGSSGKIWKVHRKLLSPMFSVKVLESYVEIFGAKAKILMEKLDELADGTPFNINEKLGLCTLDANCMTLVGSESNTQEAGYSELKMLHNESAELIFNRAAYPWQLIPWIYPLTSDGRKAKKVMKGLEKYNAGIVARKLAEYRHASGDRHEETETGTGKTFKSMLDLLIEASETQGSILTERDLLDEVTTMTAAGLITTSLAMCTLLLLIAIHPEWQDALFAEMSDIFADDMSRPATHLDLSKMLVMDRVIRETLRMYPAVTLIPRYVPEDIILPSGYMLPAGCLAVVLSYFVHRDPKNYPEPEKFLPDRWLPGSNTNRHSYAYLPFGAGARNCIGQKYSLFIIKSIISQLLRRFKISTNLTMQDLEKLEIMPFLRLPSGSYQLKLKKRVDVR